MIKVSVNRDISREERERDNKLMTKVAEKRGNGDTRWKTRRGTEDRRDGEGVRRLE